MFNNDAVRKNKLREPRSETVLLQSTVEAITKLELQTSKRLFHKTSLYDAAVITGRSERFVVVNLDRPLKQVANICP